MHRQVDEDGKNKDGGNLQDVRELEAPAQNHGLPENEQKVAEKGRRAEGVAGDFRHDERHRADRRRAEIRLGNEGDAVGGGEHAGDEHQNAAPEIAEAPAAVFQMKLARTGSGSGLQSRAGGIFFLSLFVRFGHLKIKE